MQGTVSNMLDENVVQPLLVTTSALSLATECVRMILKVHICGPMPVTAGSLLPVLWKHFEELKELGHLLRCCMRVGFLSLALA